ncbi:hypothetical protein Tco_0685944, partial [Tanacetum coccineum]
MSTPKFAETHNLVAFLEKPKESSGFEEIIDFLNASYVQYALTVNPTIYTTCIEQFWASAKAKIVNGERQIQALVDKKKVIITETSIRSDLKLDDAEGIDCLPTASIFAELERMGAKTTAWNEFSSTMASAIICLATNQTFNFSKYIFDNLVKHLEGGEDASKQGRKIKDLDADAKVTLVNETQEMNDNNLMFDTGVLEEQEIEFEKVVEEPVVSVATTTKLIPVSAAEVVTTANANVEVPDELTLTQTLIEIKTAKPKPITTAATTVTSVRPRAKGIIFYDHEEQLQAKLIEEKRLARQKEEEANITLIESWDNTQAMMEAYFKLAQRLQAEEQGEITIEERSRLFVELMNRRKKHFAKLRAEEIRRNPPTKAQKRNQMSTYLKNMAGFKHSQLKSKRYDEIQKLFDKEMKRVNTFVDINSEVVKGSETRTEESS